MKYRVLDRGMGEGVRMVATKDREWFAGDELADKDIPATDIAWLLEQGVIEVIEEGE